MGIQDTWNSAKQAVNATVDKWAVKPDMGSTRGSTVTTFNNQEDKKYNVSSHSYPSDLMSATGDYGGNYVIFYINVAVDSKLAQSLSEQDFVSDITPRDRGDLIAQNLTKDKLFAGAAALNVGGAVLGKALGAGGASATAAGLATVGAGATALMAASATRSQRRLKTAIAMHVPNQLSIRYGMQWNEDDTGALAMATTAATELMAAVKNKDAKNLTEPAKAIITNLALSKGPNAAGMSAATGLAANPKKEQIFKGVDFRSFTFDYQFFPRDTVEAQNVLNIIKQFKYHMHPEFAKDSGNFIYIYPSEFDIFYYQNGAENRNLHRHTSCVLTELNVNYTPNGAFTTFANGMPTQINVTMNFKELALLTKDKIEDGL
jgi:hypothetical protein